MTQFYAYVDETGDLGNRKTSPRSSPIFGMAGVVVDDQGAKELREVIDDLRTTLRVPEDKPLSWKRHLRKHEDRKMAARKLGELDRLAVTYVYTDKDAVTGAYTSNRGYLYNYVAGKMFRNLMWTAQNTVAPDPQLTIRFGHVINFDHTAVSKPYLMDKVGADPRIRLPILSDLQWVQATKYRESSAADIFAGFLHAAITKDRYGDVEGMYLSKIWHLIRNSHTCVVPTGLMPMPNYSLLKQYDWFSCDNCVRVHGKG